MTVLEFKSRYEDKGSYKRVAELQCSRSLAIDVDLRWHVMGSVITTKLVASIQSALPESVGQCFFEQLEMWRTLLVESLRKLYTEWYIGRIRN